MAASIGGIIISSGVTFGGIPQPAGSAFGTWQEIPAQTYVSDGVAYATLVNLTTVDDGPGELAAEEMFSVEASIAFGYLSASNDFSSLIQVRGVASRATSGAPVVTGTQLLSSGNAAGDTGRIVMSGNDVLIESKTTYAGNVRVAGLWRVIGPISLPS